MSHRVCDIVVVFGYFEVSTDRWDRPRWRSSLVTVANEVMVPPGGRLPVCFTSPSVAIAAMAAHGEVLRASFSVDSSIRMLTEPTGRYVIERVAYVEETNR